MYSHLADQGSGSDSGSQNLWLATAPVHAQPSVVQSASVWQL